MSNDQKKARERVVSALASAAALEQQLGRDGFVELPERIRSELALLQAQCAPKDDSLEAMLACEHLLESYHKHLTDAVNVSNQMQAESARRRERMRAGAGKKLVIGALVVVVLSGGVLAYRQALAAKRDDCRQAAACRQSGLCGAELRTEPALALECRATSEEHCKSSSDCTSLGRCGLLEGACVAARDEDCRPLAACKDSGACSAKGGECVAFTARDCRSTKGCLELGKCTPVDGVCRADSDADCRLSELCKKTGACQEVDGRCVTAPKGFGK